MPTRQQIERALRRVLTAQGLKGPTYAVVVPVVCGSDAASFPVGGHTVWGMTAGAIRYFCEAWKRAERQKQRRARRNLSLPDMT